MEMECVFSNAAAKEFIDEFKNNSVLYLDNPKKDKAEFDKVIERIRISLNNSFLEKADYFVSSEYSCIRKP